MCAEFFVYAMTATHLLNSSLLPDQPSPNWDSPISFQLMLESAPIAIVVADAAGRILYVNAKLEELFGYTRSELRGQMVELLMPTHFHAAHLAHRAHYMQSPRVRSMGSGLDLAGRHKDGSEFPIEAGLSYLTLDNGSEQQRESSLDSLPSSQVVVVATITDISRRKQMATLLEERVMERTQELERRRQVADGLRDIVTMLNTNRPLEQILERIVRQAAQQLNAQASAVWRMSEQKRVLEPQVYFEVGEQPAFEAILPLYSDNTQDQLFLTQQSVAIADLSPFSAAQLPLQHHSEIDPLLAVPILVRQEVAGSLVLYYTARRHFSPEELALLQTFADHAALAIESARLYTQIEQNAVAAERNRLARDLHDAVTQTLFSASMIADVLPRIWQRNPEEGHRRLAELRELTRGALAEMRTLLLELRPAKLIEVEIGELLRQLAEAISGRTRVPVEVKITGEPIMPTDVKIAFYRIAQEALNNVAKHAQARHVQLQLACQPAAMSLTVTDDGTGFVFATITPEHLGLGIMRERAEDIGATLRVQSAPGQGTQITVEWQP